MADAEDVMLNQAADDSRDISATATGLFLKDWIL
jgi:hypothetical protein